VKQATATALYHSYSEPWVWWQYLRIGGRAAKL